MPTTGTGTGIPIEAPSDGYATTSDLADYLGIALSALPADAERMLERASADVDYWTRGRIDTDNAAHTAAAKIAACAQVEMFMELGEAAAIGSAVTQRTVGRVSETYAAGGQAQLAPRAHRALMMAGLLYAGAGIR